MKSFILFTAMLVACVIARSESDNNDCFWFQRCTFVEFDGNDDPVESSTKYLYPNNEDCKFEIQFDYASNYQRADCPLTIYLNELNSKKERVYSQRIGTLTKSMKSSVVYKSEQVSIFVHGYQITVTAKGEILLYKTEGRKFVNARAFLPSEMQELIYGIRYEVLVNKLQNIQWSN